MLFRDCEIATRNGLTPTRDKAVKAQSYLFGRSFAKGPRCMGKEAAVGNGHGFLMQNTVIGEFTVEETGNRSSFL